MRVRFNEPLPGHGGDVVIGILGVGIFVFAIYMLVVSVKDRRRQAAADPAAAAASLRPYVPVVGVIGIVNTLFLILLAATGPAKAIIFAMPLVVAYWLIFVYIVRRSRPPEA